MTGSFHLLEKEKIILSFNDPVKKLIRGYGISKNALA